MANSSKKDDQNQGALLDVIQIFESGEVTLIPDHAKVVIICSNTKDSADEVKTSVNKRVDYILQTFRSHNIGRNSYTVDRCLKRRNLKYHFRVEILVQFIDFAKCQEVSNFLVEKLDTTVEIGMPTFHYSPGKLESLRRQACLVALHNAKVKAVEMARSLNQTLGRARQIQEESTEEYTGSMADLTHEHGNNDGTFQELLKLATVTVVTKICVSFELKGKTKKRK